MLRTVVAMTLFLAAGAVQPKDDVDARLAMVGKRLSGVASLNIAPDVLNDQIFSNDYNVQDAGSFKGTMQECITKCCDYSDCNAFSFPSGKGDTEPGDCWFKGAPPGETTKKYRGVRYHSTNQWNLLQ